MPNPHPLAGVYAASVTPLHPDGTLDLSSVPSLLQFFASRGCHGALFFGTTGEGPSFSPAEREVLLHTVVDARRYMPDFRLLAGTGTPSLSETKELTWVAFRLGFEGVVVLPPYYYRKVSDDGLYDWFSELIREAVPAGKYVLGYHIPGLTGVGFSLDLLERLKTDFPDRFAGIKDSSHDEAFARALGERFGDHLLVLNGTDSYLQLAMQNGAQGCITAPANLISPDLRLVWDAIRAGQDATSLQRRVTEQRHILERISPFPPVLKPLLHRLHELPRWSVRFPLEPLSPEQEEGLVSEMTQLV
jgi:4-hydroxy-tetrahydrodipicolinate synthase